MAKVSKRARKTAAGPAWRTQWPRNGDLATWLRAVIRKCDAIPDVAEAAEKAQLPIEHLAEIGRAGEALQHVDRYLRRLPRQKVLWIVRIARLGAAISLELDNVVRMERYLAIMEAT